MIDAAPAIWVPAAPAIIRPAALAVLDLTLVRDGVADRGLLTLPLGWEDATLAELVGFLPIEFARLPYWAIQEILPLAMIPGAPMFFVGAGKSSVLVTGGSTLSVAGDWNVADNAVHCIGGAGKGNSGNFNGSGGLGGGGGAWAADDNMVLTPGASVSVQVGSGDTWVVSSATLKADGGSGSSPGTAGSSVGDRKSSGGSAGFGGIGSGGMRGGGGGGAGGGPAGTGDGGSNGGSSGGISGNVQGGAGGTQGAVLDSTSSARPGGGGRGGNVSSGSCSTGSNGSSYGGGSGGGAGSFSGSSGSGSPAGGCILAVNNVSL